MPENIRENTEQSNSDDSREAEEQKSLYLRVENPRLFENSVIKDTASCYLASMELQNEAVQAIENLPPKEQSKWWAYQRELSGTYSGSERSQILQARNEDFPQISRLLGQSRQLINLGYQVPAYFSGLELTNKPVSGASEIYNLQLAKAIAPGQYGAFPGFTDSDLALSARLVQDRDALTTVSVLPYEISKLLEPRNSPFRFSNSGRLSIDMEATKRAIPEGLLNSNAWSASLDRNFKPDSQTLPGRLNVSNPFSLFDLSHRNRLTGHQPAGLNLIAERLKGPNIFESSTYEAPQGPIASLAISAQKTLETMDRPTQQEVLDGTTDMVVDKIAEYAPDRVGSSNRYRLARDFQSVYRSRKTSFNQKLDLASQLDRMITAGDNEAITPQMVRAVVAAQIVNQASNIRTVDQGSNKTCNVSTVEKLMLANYPDLLAESTADVAITGNTKTRMSGIDINLDPSWLAVQRESRLSYPPTDNVRSQASTYFALIGVNSRYQKLNEKHGSDLKFAHLNGRDIVMDFSQNPPVPVYDVRVFSGRHRYSARPELGPEDKIEVDKDMQVVMEQPESSPNTFSKDIIDMYEELSGRSGKGIMVGPALMCNDPFRAQIYFEKSDLHEILTNAHKNRQFPLIFDQPGHVTTVNGYDPIRQIAQYDNQWGDDSDSVGDQGMPLDILWDRGIKMDPDYVERLDRWNKVRIEYRKNYESWCKHNGVEPDSRYPSPDEIASWQNHQSGVSSKANAIN